MKFVTEKALQTITVSAMEYIAKTENGVAKGRSKQGIPYWDPMASDELANCLDPNVSESYLTSLFPGPCFFGRLVGSAKPCEMVCALNILRLTKELHESLKGIDDFLGKRNEDAVRVAARIEQVINGYEGVSLVHGNGYGEDDEDDFTVPCCHIYSLTVSIPPAYANWLRPRVSTFADMGGIFPAPAVFYLLMSSSMELVDGERGALLKLDVFGFQSLSSDFEPWLTNYENGLPKDCVLSGLELLAGLAHLADVLATLHTLTALPVISRGKPLRATAGDSLTDLWFMCYDITEDANYSIGVCEVCHRLYVGTSKRKRGHEACMNRQRVEKSRARKYKRMLEEGVSKAEAAKIAGISVDKAAAIINAQGFDG